ncbi:MAG: TolC family protein [Candidatus Melainabacteria bacterium]|nr:MAG: TolC family protein [Candidatus Melainabacteria bacterium]
MRLKELLLISSIFLAGCAQQGGGGNSAATVSQPGAGILGSLRPKTDPAVVERMRLEEQARLEKQKALEAAAQRADNQVSADGMGRVLPKVSMDPIAPPAEEVANSNGPIFTPANQSGASPIPVPTGGSSSSAPSAMTYGGTSVPGPPPGGGVGGGLVPPPPAVTLSTQANIGMPAGMPMDPAAMYANPYMNPYAIPYPMQNMQAMVPPAPQVALARPSGSPFATGPRSSADDDEGGSVQEKRRANFVPITPTGMEARSAYKQRDDLKALWNGVLKSNAMSLLMKDEKFASQLGQVDIGLPGEATRGSFSISQRQVDAVFKNNSLDKRILQPVRKVQSDLVQAYYRYLYSYNKYALAQQTVAARKQEAEVASSDSERQRAAADQSQAQSDVDSAKDDMKSAQTELSMIAGPQAAKFIISKVSGVTPTNDALASSGGDSSDSKSGNSGGGMFGLFHFGGGGGNEKKKASPALTETKVASAPADTKKEKETKKKGKKDSSASREKTADLSPAPEASESTASSEPVPLAPNGISFELKNVNVTARKSILTVSIRNGSANSFSFSPDVISISEGNHKLSEAAVRADFDQTMVQPNSEVKGTITIFGRPWNDRLAVSLSEGGKTIQMSRKQ